MKVTMLEHVNLRTASMEALAQWYETIPGLKRGYRPPFGVTGIWLYAGDIPVIHLLETTEEPKTMDPRMEHFAMRATGLESFLQRLEKHEVSHNTYRIPRDRIFQVYLSDPEGNHMHIDFPPEEADLLGL
jgi:catechol 2,3-dioxygenase-like lactoylglutathione lyase family enzyme